MEADQIEPVTAHSRRLRRFQDSQASWVVQSENRRSTGDPGANMYPIVGFTYTRTVSPGGTNVADTVLH